MVDDGRRKGAYTAKVEGFEIVDKVRDGSGVLAQGLDMFTAYAGSVVGAGQHALFTIRVFYDGNTGTIKKRFSEFSTLHAELQKCFPGSLSFDLPDKGLVRNFSEQALRDRVQLLNVYVKALVASPSVAQHPASLAFFRIGPGGIFMPVQGGMDPRTAAEDPVGGEVDLFDPTFMGTPASGRPPAANPVMHTMADDDRSRPTARASYSAQIERFDIVGATSANEGVLGQGLDMLFSAAGSMTGGGGTYAMFTVKVQSRGEYSSIKKRFSDFEKLHTELLRSFPSSLGLDLPDKGMVRNFSNEALADRARSLNAYLRALSGHREASQHPAALAFFGLSAGAGRRGGGAAVPYESSATAVPVPVPSRAGGPVNGRATAPVSSGRRPDDEDDLAGWDTPSL